MPIKDQIVALFAELQPQVRSIAVGIAKYEGKDAIGISLIPKAGQPVTFTVPDDVYVVFKKGVRPITASTSEN